MKKSRAYFTVSVDLDLIPGWGHEPADFQALILNHLLDTVPHYNPVVEQQRVDAAPEYHEQVQDLAQQLAEDWDVIFPPERPQFYVLQDEVDEIIRQTSIRSQLD